MASDRWLMITCSPHACIHLWPMFGRDVEHVRCKETFRMVGCMCCLQCRHSCWQGGRWHRLFLAWHFVFFRAGMCNLKNTCSVGCVCLWCFCFWSYFAVILSCCQRSPGQATGWENDHRFLFINNCAFLQGSSLRTEKCNKLCEADRGPRLIVGTNWQI